MYTYYKRIRLLILGIFISISICSFAQTIDFQVVGKTVTEKDTFVVAIQSVDDLTGEGVFAYRFQITYSSAYLEFLGIDSVGDMLSGWDIPTINLTSPGNLRLAGAGADAVEGSGDFIYLKFRAIRYGGSYVGFNTDQSYLNEGSPASAYTSGYMNIAQRSYPNITPDSRQMYVGDEVAVSATGGLEPYTFDTENNSVAQIIGNTTLRAVGPGTTRAFVTDANSEVNYSSGVFDVRAIRMSIPGGESVWPSQTILLPLNIEVAPGTQVFSGSIDLSFPAGLTPAESEIQQGDYSISVEHRIYSNKISISFASGSGVTGSGVLMYVPFVGNTSGNQYISFQKAIFNEILTSFVTNNHVLVNTLPNLSLTPNSGSLMWGETININVSNGNPPYSYESSDTNIATVDAAGEVTGVSGGEFTVKVTDNFGATVTSGTFVVNDHTLTINNTDGDLDNNTQVAVSSSQLPTGRNIFSFEGAINFQSDYLEYIGVDAADPGMLIEATLSGNTINMVGAGSNPVSSGNLFYLIFKVKNDLSIFANTPVSFNGFSINEGDINSVLVNGAVTRVEQASYRPVADAGSNFSVDENTNAQLDGSGSYDNDGDSFTYSWTAPQGITLDDSTLVDPSFTAPEVNQNTNYTFTLVTNDGSSDSDPSSVIVTVLQVNKTPVAQAGADMSYPEGTNVSLDGSGSSDADGQALIYNWQSLDGVVLFNPNSVSPSFIAPSVQSDTPYRFRLTVNDGVIDSDADTVSITVLQVNQIPQAHAGVDQQVDEGDVVQLNGTLSSDPDNDDITYLWTSPPEVSLSSNTIAQPTFTAPDVRLDSTLTFSLVVNDGQSNSIPDEVIISVANTDVLSDEAEIINVTLDDLQSINIDSEAGTVSLQMPYGYDVRSLEPDFELSTWATISPVGGTERDFSIPQTYVVTAENGTTTKEWTVSINIPELILSRSIASGWNMLSLSVMPDDLDIDEVLSSLTFEQLDYLKSPLASSTWYSDYGWFGDLAEFPAYLTVKLKKGTSGTLQITGNEINPTLEPIRVISGWNSLPYLLKANADIDDAILPSSIPGGDILVKGESGASVYVAGSGWVGDLQTMETLHGYRINVQYSGNLMYDASAVNPIPPVAQLKQASLSHNFSNDYRYSANIISVIVDEFGTPITGENDKLRAYNNGVLCGEANANYVSGSDQYIFVLSYYANENGETINFKTVHNGQEVDLEFSKQFMADDLFGSASDPEQLVLPIATDIDNKSSLAGITISPNPATDYILINSQTDVLNVSIYNSSGAKLIEDKNLGRISELNIDYLPNGIYFIEITVTNGVYLHKFIKKSK